MENSLSIFNIKGTQPTSPEQSKYAASHRLCFALSLENQKSTTAATKDKIELMSKMNVDEFIMSFMH